MTYYRGLWFNGSSDLIINGLTLHTATTLSFWINTKYFGTLLSTSSADGLSYIVISIDEGASLSLKQANKSEVSLSG